MGKQSHHAPDLSYRTLFTALPESYIIFAANDPIYTIVDINPAQAKIMMTRPKDIIGKPLFEAFPDVSEKYFKTVVSDMRDSFKRVVRTRKRHVMGVIRYDIKNQAGEFVERYWRTEHLPILNDDGSVAFILQTAQDVTEETKREHRLRQIEHQLSNALSIGQVGSWQWTAATDTFTGDKTLATMFGLDPDEAESGISFKAFLAVIHPDDRDRVAKAIKTTLDSHERYNDEFRTFGSDGTIHWVIARGQTELEDNGQTAQLLGAVVDITDRKRSEDAQAKAIAAENQARSSREEALRLQKRNEELVVLNRTKDEFIALASHQLRTPATGVKQYLGMLLNGYSDPLTESQLSFIERAYACNERQLRIVEDILRVAQVDLDKVTLHRRPTDIGVMLKDIAETQSAMLANKSQSITLKLPRKPIMASVDLERFRMAIDNLVDNASKYSYSDSTITIALRRRGAYFYISVADKGVGIRKRDIPKLFQKFSRLENPLSVQVGGNGLGLYWTSKIVDMHGGAIQIDSKLHHGTTFTVRLPFSEAT